MRGKIDNCSGHVTSEIWLAGIDQPLVLELTGDCAPDLAGCELSFENPDPSAMTTKPPAPQLFAIREDVLELIKELRSR